MAAVGIRASRDCSVATRALSALELRRSSSLVLRHSSFHSGIPGRHRRDRRIWKRDAGNSGCSSGSRPKGNGRRCSPSPVTTRLFSAGRSATTSTVRSALSTRSIRSSRRCLFAGDRFESRSSARDALAAHDVVVLDRYVASNVAHQAARLDGAERERLIRGDRIPGVRALPAAATRPGRAARSERVQRPATDRQQAGPFLHRTPRRHSRSRRRLPRARPQLVSRPRPARAKLVRDFLRAAGLAAPSENREEIDRAGALFEVGSDRSGRPAVAVNPKDGGLRPQRLGPPYENLLRRIRRGRADVLDAELEDAALVGIQHRNAAGASTRPSRDAWGSGRAAA